MRAPLAPQFLVNEISGGRPQGGGDGERQHWKAKRKAESKPHGCSQTSNIAWT